MRPMDRNGNAREPEIMGLQALGWVLSDDSRAHRLLALTGLDADQLRARAGDRTVLASVLDFLLAHEPDLVACADALDVPPEGLAAAARELAR